MAIDTPARIAILGAGPIGLEAALYARYLGYGVDLFERGAVAESVRRWGHVRMFTPFAENCSPLGLAALRAQDSTWTPPAADALLTGREYRDAYLVPLAKSDLLVDCLHEHTEVLAIGREGWLKSEGAGAEDRADSDFKLLVRGRDANGHPEERYVTAAAVIDTTGTYGRANWCGADGLPAPGELAAAPHIEYGLPDVLGPDRDRYASHGILLIGDGDSAIATLVALAELAAQAPDTWITWVTRPRGNGEQSLETSDDPYPQRARLARQARQLAAGDANHITHRPNATVASIAWHADLERFSVELSDAPGSPEEFHQVIANVGYRGDTSLYDELQVVLDGVTGGPRLQDPHGIATSETDFYVLGAKTHARDPRFRIAEGLDQIRRVFAILGDREELDLYATMPQLQ